MAVKLLDFSSLERELEIHPGTTKGAKPFRVRVKYVSRPALVERMREEPNISLEESAERWAALAIDGWSGLTPQIARALNVPMADESAGPDGAVPYDQEAAAVMWLYASGDRFSAAIQKFAFGLLDTVEKEKADAKNG